MLESRGSRGSTVVVGPTTYYTLEFVCSTNERLWRNSGYYISYVRKDIYTINEYCRERSVENCTVAHVLR